MNLDISRLLQLLGHQFSTPSLLQQALTHRSFGQPHNERLEFLGDAILSAVSARLLFDAFPRMSEGELSRLRASLVKKESLAELASELGLGSLMWMGEGEVKSGGQKRPSILADALEAIFAAVYLDAGYEAAYQVISRVLRPKIEQLDPETHGKDPKTRLQEWLQAHRHPLPEYLILHQKGDAHDQQFEVECRLPGLSIVSRGHGPSRRAAEQVAAEVALSSLPRSPKR
ncbi:ribonuclease III [Parachitinimonas caeni]|uniref:Ribonuclease 3 n=1 Tax=Parachitinimonas caeni TaxID=3031301 RepID=A0ABT7DW02_9NEIS|nr:ribonuclease III [Parachitinimonas caeni]MDK2124237.1 ribonuclease III [Parachitinimonas caeni]